MLRVDNIPWFLKPFFLLFGYGVGIFFYLYSYLMHATCKIRFEGSTIPTNSGVVYCIWHKHLLLYFTVFTEAKNQVWMNHPAWYMKPVHVLLRLTGVKHICLGSSGNSGKEALKKVIGFLKQGYYTTVACDGPAGPPQVMKPGVLLMSRDAGIPVVPLHFSCSRSFRLGGWDKKIVPGLFSEITVTAGAPLQVTLNNMEEAAEILTRHLDAEDA